MTKFALKDVTAATWKTLTTPPDGSATPPEASALCLRDVATCKSETKDRSIYKAYYARNSDWNPRPLPKLGSPISWPFLKQPMFRRSAYAKWDIFNLAQVAEPPAGYTVKIYSVTYSGASVPPQFIGVAFPMDLDISKPPPFLVHYKHIPGQGPGSLFKYFDPLGFDWLHHEIWNWFVYNVGKRPNGDTAWDMPFFSNQQFSFGFPYQLRQANKQYVVVLPQISRIFEPSTKKLRDYQLYSAAMLRDILIAIQKDILPIKDDTLSHVAISANSSGCNVLSSFLTDNLAAMRSNASIATFMNDEFNELFILDPPEGFGDAMVSSLAGWRKLASSRSAHKGKCIRFYTHSHTKKFADLTNTNKDPFTEGQNGFWKSASNTISLAYLPYLKSGDDVWQQTYDEVVSGGRMTVSNFAFVHHVIPALCLTDAAASSLYV